MRPLIGIPTQEVQGAHGFSLGAFWKRWEQRIWRGLFDQEKLSKKRITKGTASYGEISA